MGVSRSHRVNSRVLVCLAVRIAGAANVHPMVARRVSIGQAGTEPFTRAVVRTAVVEMAQSSGQHWNSCDTYYLMRYSLYGCFPGADADRLAELVRSRADVGDEVVCPQPAAGGSASANDADRARSQSAARCRRCHPRRARPEPANRGRRRAARHRPPTGTCTRVACPGAWSWPRRRRAVGAVECGVVTGRAFDTVPHPARGSARPTSDGAGYGALRAAGSRPRRPNHPDRGLRLRRSVAPRTRRPPRRLSSAGYDAATASNGRAGWSPSRSVRIAAWTNARKSGCGRVGRDLNSG